MKRTVSDQYVFECNFCGVNFGTDVIELALHIRKVHDRARNYSHCELKNEMQ